MKLLRLTWLCLFVGASTVLLNGCGPPAGVTVQVSLKFPPNWKVEDTDNIEIVFMPEDGKGLSGTATGSSKDMPLTLVRTGATGVPPGKYKVAIKVTPYAGGSKADRTKQFDDLNKTYQSANSKVTCEVTSDPKQSFVIDLTNGSVSKQ